MNLLKWLVAANVSRKANADMKTYYRTEYWREWEQTKRNDVKPFWSYMI